ncbi:MAG: FAD-binding protein, partial [Alphaproteobacteria bacterium]|nr:FAD-binding protein [Alphaproteobacteria bacterium]
ALKAGIGGLEFLSGIPGKVGGALAMNAGAYGTEVKDVLVEAQGLLPDGSLHILSPADLKMSYRHTELPQGLILTSAILRGRPEAYDTVKARLTDIKEKRNASQPIREKTGGSTFANPSTEDLARAGLPEGTRAWQMVELVGGRGLKIGGAQMSEQHCNFMINTGDAKASDLEALGDELIHRAQDKWGLALRWEIKRIGEAL